ncbi:hypothetical protein JOF41_000894 [Saccharothrix coeruleofusca]|uniref:hypothetical protein n=1 Tax=Saccharothrix coeruleofusca TaxID=33919 RepID=UPI001AE16DC2|nr:hypothetical protein [Saccharothrix coeruleofusca]MBP2334716.1 hypothetical protein [Saccharothrix coeruleofusca]
MSRYTLRALRALTAVLVAVALLPGSATTAAARSDVPPTDVAPSDVPPTGEFDANVVGGRPATRYYPGLSALEYCPTCSPPSLAPSPPPSTPDVPTTLASNSRWLARRTGRNVGGRHVGPRWRPWWRCRQQSRHSDVHGRVWARSARSVYLDKRSPW